MARYSFLSIFRFLFLWKFEESLSSLDSDAFQTRGESFSPFFFLVQVEPLVPEYVIVTWIRTSPSDIAVLFQKPILCSDWVGVFLAQKKNV